jgi:hypothetical protein
MCSQPYLCKHHASNVLCESLPCDLLQPQPPSTALATLSTDSSHAMPCFAAGKTTNTMSQAHVPQAAASLDCELPALTEPADRRTTETDTNTVPPNPSTGEPQRYTAPCNCQASGPNTSKSPHGAKAQRSAAKRQCAHSQPCHCQHVPSQHIPIPVTPLDAAAAMGLRHCSCRLQVQKYCAAPYHSCPSTLPARLLFTSPWQSAPGAPVHSSSGSNVASAQSSHPVSCMDADATLEAELTANRRYP